MIVNVKLGKNMLLCIMMKSDIIIIGGGAAGLFAAAMAATRGVSVILLEKNGRCGRKIALTGKGRCNLTNTKPWEEFQHHVHPKNIFFKNAFFAMDNIKVMEFFESIGLPLVVERGDRVFPKSMRAQDVTDTLVSWMESRGVDIITDCEVEEIKKDADSGIFTVIADGSPVASSKNVIVATGGLSYPVTGSTGDGYRFAKSFGHKIVECFPSLTALVPAGYSEQYHGISLKNVEATLLINNQPVQSEFGDIDFTNGGMEGPIGFKISRKAVQNLRNGQKVSVLLDLKPAVSLKQLADRIQREIAALSAGQRDELEKNQERGVARHLLPKLMPKALVEPFVSSCRTNSGSSKRGLTIENLPHLLKEWRFEIRSNVGYERCVVTAGGVSLQEISKKSMESKLVQGLYFVGEVLDLDGDTGGYNLQIAFSTAALAVESVCKSK